MSALDRVREKFKTPQYGTDKTDKRFSVSSVSSRQGQTGNSQRLDVELERRLRAMARRWRYTDSDLEEVLKLAGIDPVAWVLAVGLDERRFGAGESKWDT